MNMKFTIKTIGCKVNTYESNKIRDELINIGLEYVDVNDKDEYKNLDFYIVNTCSVTSVADKKSRQMLHLAKKYNPNVKTIAIGCLVDSINGKEASVGASIASPLAGIDYCLSNNEKINLVSLITTLVGESESIGEKKIPVSPRAFIKIEDGCDEYCTYCLIPYLRGHIKSRDDEDIIKEISEKVRLGVKEVVLTGIHLSSFGLDRKNLNYENEGAIGFARESLSYLIGKISNICEEVDGEKREVERIRLGSLEPRIINESFIEFLALPSAGNNISVKFCPSFCLSLQSGSDKTLKRMNRHYTTEDYKKACEIIRKYLPNATITTDVIVGFPGETEEDFNESLEFVKSMRFYNPNIFPYSKREGTKAAKLPDQLDKKIKHDRALIMIKECEAITSAIETANSVVGTIKIPGKNEILGDGSDTKEKTANPIKVGDIIDDVLVEEIVEENGAHFAIGYTKNYMKKRIPIVEGGIGKFFKGLTL